MIAGPVRVDVVDATTGHVMNTHAVAPVAAIGVEIEIPSVNKLLLFRAVFVDMVNKVLTFQHELPIKMGSDIIVRHGGARFSGLRRTRWLLVFVVTGEVKNWARARRGVDWGWCWRGRWRGGCGGRHRWVRE